MMASPECAQHHYIDVPQQQQQQEQQQDQEEQQRGPQTYGLMGLRPLWKYQSSIVKEIEKGCCLDAHGQEGPLRTPHCLEHPLANGADLRGDLF